MSKKISLMVFVMLAGAMSGLVGAELLQPKQGNDNVEITSVINKLMDNISRTGETLDAEKTLSMLTDEPGALFFLNSKAYGKNELVKVLGGIYGNLKSMKINMNKPKVTVLGPDTAMWTATGTASSVSKSGETYEEILTETWIWKKINGKWQVIHSHESVEVPAPPAIGK